MANWLTAAVEALGRRPPRVVPFEITCECGQRLRGRRRPQAQFPACPNCDRTLFVLPLDVYPPPPPPPAPAKPRPPGKRRGLLQRCRRWLRHVARAWRGGCGVTAGRRSG